MDTNTLVIHSVAAGSQLQEAMLYVFDCLSLSHIFENEKILAAFRGFIERASDGELSKVSLVRKVVSSDASLKSPKINTKEATTIISGCVDSLSINIDSQNFWQKESKVLEGFSIENSPVIRFKRIDDALSKIDLKAGITDRILKVLLSHEHDNVLLEYKARYSDATASSGLKQVNAYMAEALDIELKKLKNLRTESNKYMALMHAFGPGILFVLGGTKNTWHKLSNDACTVVILYLETHLHEVVELAASLNFTAAVIILYGMLLVGTNIDIVKLKETKLGSIILKYVRVLDDGTLDTENDPDGSIDPGDRGNAQGSERVVAEDGEDEEEDEVYKKKILEAVEDIHSSLNPPRSSSESIPADGRSARASVTPEVIPHDSDAAHTRTRMSHQPAGDNEAQPHSPAQRTTNCNSPSKDKRKELPHDNNNEERVPKRRHQANMRQGPRTVSLPPLQIASSQWMPAGAGCNPQLQSDNNEPSSHQAASLLFAIRNHQATLATPMDSSSLPHSSEGFRQPPHYSQQSESTQNSALYAPILVVATSPPEYQIDTSTFQQLSGRPSTLDPTISHEPVIESINSDKNIGSASYITQKSNNNALATGSYDDVGNVNSDIDLWSAMDLNLWALLDDM